jgi:hypothetical protein
VATAVVGTTRAVAGSFVPVADSVAARVAACVVAGITVVGIDVAVGAVVGGVVAVLAAVLATVLTTVAAAVAVGDGLLPTAKMLVGVASMGDESSVRIHPASTNKQMDQTASRLSDLISS